MEERTTQRIETLRAKLYEIVAEYDGNLLHPRVIHASQCLDAEIADIMLAQSYSASVSVPTSTLLSAN